MDGGVGWDGGKWEGMGVDGVWEGMVGNGREWDVAVPSSPQTSGIKR